MRTVEELQETQSQTSLKGQATQKLGDVKDQASQKVGEATDQAKQAATDASEQAKGALRHQLDQRSTQWGETITSQTQTLQSISQQLRNDGKEKPAELVDKACEQASRFGEYLERSDADAIISDIEELARRQPWLVAAAAFGLGMIGSRLVKASSEQRYTASA